MAEIFYTTLSTTIFPNEFNPKTCNPQDIEEKRLFGLPMPSSLVWTCLPFYKVPKLFLSKRLALKINGVGVSSFLSFVKSMLFPNRLEIDSALKIIETSVDKKLACGIDISIGLRGLADHVMFVFGYDENNLYVIDTHKAEKIDYEKLTPNDDNRFIMKLPRETVKKMWSRFGRVWQVAKIQ